MAGDQATNPLIRRRRTNGTSSSSSSRSREDDKRPNLWPARILSIVSLLMLIGAAIYFHYEVHQLLVTIAEDEAHIDSLQSTVDSQKVVIDRFNNSVTNSDVLLRLDTLEKTLSQTKSSLEHDLKDTEIKIDAELKDTLVLLNQTVKVAQQDIQDEVDKVKSDVESYVRTTQDQFSAENDFMVYQLAGTFTLLSCLISMWHMTAHLRRFNQPVVQRKILAILWMSPIYAVTSWLSLVFKDAEPYLAIVKDFYEAYVIYQFLSFCIAVLGKGNREAVVDLLAAHADHLTPPFRCCGCFRPDPYETPRQLADAVLMQCQRFAMQFVFLRPLTSIALFVLDKTEYYGAGSGPTDYRSPQFWLVGLQNLSVFVAFTGLLKFYHAVDEDLAWCRPFAKFCCIKGVVFMTFWQGLAIAVLAGATEAGGENAEAWAKQAQNFLICLEMLLFSIAHFYCFPTEEWEEGYRVKHTDHQIGDSIALGDFLQDLKLLMMAKKEARRKSELTAVTEGDEEEIDVEEGQKDALKTPREVAASGLIACSPEEESAILDLLDQGSDLDDDEIEEATKRLLAGTLSTTRAIEEIWGGENGEPLYDDGGYSGEHDDGEDLSADDEDAASSDSAKEDDARDTTRDSSDVDDPEKTRDHGEGDKTKEDNHVGKNSAVDKPTDSHVPSVYGTDDGSPGEREHTHDDQPPNEMTSLLGTDAASGSSMASYNEELLRPSIFTTMSDIDTQRRMDFN